MSAEAPKPVEETPVVAAPVETPAPAAVPETTPAAEVVEPAVEAPAAVEAPKDEEAAAPVKEEVKPVEEGVLGYKGTGLLKSFMFQKKFFWFGTEPVEQKALQSYLRGEKAQDVANVNVAWASETGKGLLFFSKKATEKATPAGIFNLSEVSDITEEGTIAFHFTIAGHKHTFEATTLGERDNWVAQLKAKAAEAKELAPTVTESEKYKESHAALTKPVVAVVAPKKSAEKVEEPKKEETTTPTVVEPPKEEAKEEKKEEKKARKSRSASRKRTSIFGGFGLGKKEEKVESPKEDVPATTEETPAAVEAAAVPATTEVAAAEPAAEATPASPVEEKKEEARPAASKRNSIFGTLKSQFSHKDKKPEAEAPAVPAKDAEPVSETAPVIPAVEASEPLATEVTPAAPAEATEAPVTNGETKVEAAPVIKSDKRKSSLPWLSKKEKSAPTSDEEADKPKSPFAKLRATVKGKKTEKAAEKPAEPAAEASAAPAEATPAAEPAAEPTPVVPATTPQVVASA